MRGSLRMRDGWSHPKPAAFSSHGAGEATGDVIHVIAHVPVAHGLAWEAAAGVGRREARLAAQLPGVFQVLLVQPFGRAKDVVLRHIG